MAFGFANRFRFESMHGDEYDFLCYISSFSFCLLPAEQYCYYQSTHRSISIPIVCKSFSPTVTKLYLLLIVKLFRTSPIRFQNTYYQCFDFFGRPSSIKPWSNFYSFFTKPSTGELLKDKIICAESVNEHFRIELTHTLCIQVYAGLHSDILLLRMYYKFIICVLKCLINYYYTLQIYIWTSFSIF